jgi:hypothetical protein
MGDARSAAETGQGRPCGRHRFDGRRTFSRGSGRAVQVRAAKVVTRRTVQFSAVGTGIDRHGFVW